MIVNILIALAVIAMFAAGLRGALGTVRRRPAADAATTARDEEAPRQ